MERQKPIDEPHESSHAVSEQLAEYPLLEALIERRSCRFGSGMRLNGGPLSYKSMHAPRPLSLEEEAALAFAGCGITRPVLAELPYDSGDEHEAGGGNIMINLVGRTVVSGDAVHAVALFAINGEGAWMLNRGDGCRRTHPLQRSGERSLCHPDPDAPPPRWMESVSSMSPPRVFGFGREDHREAGAISSPGHETVW